MYLTHFSFVCVLLIKMNHFLNKRQQKNLLKSRFNIEAPEPFYKLKTGPLSTLPCRDMYAALSFAITGTTEFRHEFCHEILHFLKHSWSNRAMYDKLEEEENVCIASYVDEQLRHFDPCRMPIPYGLRIGRLGESDLLSAGPFLGSFITILGTDVGSHFLH